ncbi:Got1/Sft2-like family-domain-containing protein [Phlyctochytrium arcticum]|nr:Got1/Sft2-like family-domain-containing protein [Phlyctochytrium arcticum]
MSSTERNFRDSLRAFNASAGRPAAPTSNSSGFSLGSMWSGDRSGVSGPRGDEATESLLGRVRTGTQNAFSGLGIGNTQQEPELFGMSRWQRIVGFAITLGLAIFCFFMASITLFVSVLNPAKFATLYTLGSILAFTSLALLQGPRAFLRHIFSKERLFFTGAYLGSMCLTLYFSIVAKNYVMIIILSLIQFAALLYYMGSYIPGGVSGLGYMTRYFARNTVGLPV